MVSKTLFAGTALLGALAFAVPAAAQQPAPGADTAGGFSRLDTNRDGTVDKTEYDAGAAAAFTGADRDNDGKLSIAELGNALRGFLGRAVIEGRGDGGDDRPSAEPRGPGDRSFDNRQRSDRFAPDLRQFAPRFRGPDGPPRFQPYFGPRFQLPYGPGYRAPLLPRFQAPYGPRFQAPLAPRAIPGPGNREQAAPQPPQPPQAPQAPQAAPTPPGFAAVDRNRDGVISPDEFASAFGRGFRGR